MGNSLAVVCLLGMISAAPALRAQDDRPKFEVYGSYNYVRFNVDSKVNGLPPSPTFNGNGGGGELLYDINRWLGVLGDTGGYWATRSVQAEYFLTKIPDGLNNRQNNFRFGAGIVFRFG